jgi:hypothetical protein
LIQQSPQGAGEGLEIDGFGDHRRRGHRTLELFQRGSTETSHDNHWQIRAKLKYFSAQLAPGQLGHGLVGDKQIEIVGILAESVQGFGAVSSGNNTVAKLAQPLLEYAENTQLVIDDQ